MAHALVRAVSRLFSTLLLSAEAAIGAIPHTEPPPVSSVVPVTPPALDRLIRKCIAKDPDNRWQNVRDIAGELQWIAETESGAPAPLLAVRLGVSLRNHFTISADGQRFLFAWPNDLDNAGQIHVLLNWPALLKKS